MKQIPIPSRRRLVTLSQILQQLEKNGARVTSSEISALTGWSDATIRRDISLLCVHSGRSNGYEVAALREAIAASLDIRAGNGGKRCCIVGLGPLGSSLLSGTAFSGSAFSLAAAFDTSMNRIELLDSDIPLYLTTELKTVIPAKGITLAVLCVPDQIAQEMADRLVSFGIRGIVNYTNTILSVPDGVTVENANVVTALTRIVGASGFSL